MASAIDALRKALEEVERKLEGFDELVQQRDRLRAAMSVLEGTVPVPVGRPQHHGHGEVEALRRSMRAKSSTLSTSMGSML